MVFGCKIEHYVAQADEVWHAGDIGKIEVIDQLQQVKNAQGSLWEYW